MGYGGAGHYVKMVHNGIEYADMQLIAEAYDLLHRGTGITNKELSEIFAEWNKCELKSYLIEITSKILCWQDIDTGKPLVDMILDQATQKGTGKWAGQHALDVGAPIPTINAAVEMRFLSSQKSERIKASQLLAYSPATFTCDKEHLIRSVEKTLHASRITSYAQGFALLRTAAREHGFGFQYSEIARIWRAGCIIRASLLDVIASAFKEDPELDNLLLFKTFREYVLVCQSISDSYVKVETIVH